MRSCRQWLLTALTVSACSGELMTSAEDAGQQLGDATVDLGVDAAELRDAASSTDASAADGGPDGPVRQNADGTFTIEGEGDATFTLCGCAEDPVALSLGPQLYAVVGREVQVFFDDLIAQDAIDYDWTTHDGIGGATDERRWFATPSAAGASSLYVVAWDDTGTPVGVGRTSVVASAADAGSGANASILFLGDSTTNAGVYVRELRYRFEADDAMGVTSVGTRGTDPDFHEGRSGWQIEDYMTDRRGAGANPFFADGGFDYAYYLSSHLSSTGVDAPEYFFVHLGINDLFAIATADVEPKMATMLGRLDEMFADILAAEPATRLAIGLTIVPCSTESGFRDAYPDQPQYTRERYKPRIVEWVRRLVEHFAGREEVALVPLNAIVDSVYGFPHVIEGGELRHTDAVHPNGDGYAQMAEQIYAWLKSR